MGSLKKKIFSFGDWLIFSLFKTEQIERMYNLLTDKQKKRLKKIMPSGNKMKQVELIKYHINELGFVERGLTELEDLLSNEDEYLRYLAGWQLAVWHANQDPLEHAKQCINQLATLTFDNNDQVLKRRKSILEAESYHRLGDLNKAKEIISLALKNDSHRDLLLAQANLAESLDDKIELINQIMDKYQNLRIAIDQDNNKSIYDQLTVDPKLIEQNKINHDQHKVTIIIPAYNAESIIETAIYSILKQTWRNIEVIVADDCSTDQTQAVVKEIAKTDQRVKIVQTKQNSGAYIARNTALKEATGEFITINDADDWSHPEKIEIQARHLLENPKVIGNMSQQVRATNDLDFYRRGQPGMYIFQNMSSLMFRREPVMEKIGYWDSVRFAADSEYIKRIKVIFGNKSIKYLETAPLSFQRQTSHSLTGNSAFGYPGYFFGARKEYREAQEDYHERFPDQLYYPFPQNKRPFPIPEPMWPSKAVKDEDGYRHFDLLIASDFSDKGDTNKTILKEIEVRTKQGLKIGLNQLYRYDLKPEKLINSEVRDLIDGDQIQVVCYGEKLTCDYLIVINPAVLQDRQNYLPTIKAKKINVIINQLPTIKHAKSEKQIYDFNTANVNLKGYFNKTGKWYPNNAEICKALHDDYYDELTEFELVKEEWQSVTNGDL
ncbi:glycosyltransferase family 2 protein [Amphibacillus sp. Q70]|uniref:glycosyltransferase family 2 protein n=1 Tax=Amphibacillus sp. Q70 TaxID=3453416 RepID=UPI003F8489E6